MDYIKLYGKFIIIYLKSKTEYGIYYFMDFVMNIFWSFISLLTIWIVLNQFGTIQGWNFYQVLFLYNLNYISFAIIGMFISVPMYELEGMIRQGTFDGILTKPINPFLHLIFKQFSHGHLIQFGFGIAVFAICVPNLNITWTIAKTLWLLLVILGSALIQGSIMVAMGSMNFWFVKATAAADVLIYELRNFIDYPIKIYTKWVQILLTFIIPYGFVNFYPSQYFLNKSEGSLFHPYFQFGTPIVGVILFSLAYRLWCYGVSKYQSTGS